MADNTAPGALERRCAEAFAVDAVDLLGAVAGVLTTVAFVPQVHKTWKTRSGRDISLGTFALFSLGVLLWLLYGVAIGSLPIVVANAVTLLLALAVLVLKLHFDRTGAKAARAAQE